MKHHRKTKPAIWTTMRHGLKPHGFIRQRDKVGGKKGARNASAAVLRTPRRAPRAKPVRRRSAAMTKRMTEYRRLRTDFLRAHPLCAACGKIVKVLEVSNPLVRAMSRFQRRNAQAFCGRPETISQHPTTEIHHRSGRSGKLLLDAAQWEAVCSEAHRYITDNPLVARAAGLLGETGKWNSQ